MPDPELRQIRDALTRIASEVTTIYEGWPTLLRTLGEISRRLEEHERRIMKLESHTFLPPKERQPSEWDLGEVSDTGSHRVLTVSEFERLKLKDKAAIWDGLKRSFGKIASHVIAVMITASIAGVVHYLVSK